VTRAFAVGLFFVVLSAPPVLQRWTGTDTAPYMAATIVIAAIAAWLGWSWRERNASDGPPEGGHYVQLAAFAIPSIVLVFLAARAWLQRILTIPHDPLHADMLIVVQEGLKRALAGENPYTIYNVPWPAPLPYGPLLWGPFALPMLMRADIRFLTVAGELFAPVVCALAAAACAWRGRLAAAAACIVVLAAMAFNTDLENFASIGHTPVYWPLLVLFAWLVAAERWRAAALLLGLLVTARTTMVAIIPALLMTVWLRERKTLVAATLLIAAGAIAPFLPFAIWDAKALTYALYGSYQNVMKTFVWTATTWVQHTIGITGVLLAHHLSRWVEALQLVAMAATYAVCWIAIRRGRSPLVWMSLALLVFSMTTLWPVSYIYFDVLVLLVAVLVSDVLWPAGSASPAGIFRAWGLAGVATIVVVIGAAAAMLPAAGPSSATATWVDDRRVATALLVRRTTTPAIIDVETGAAPAGVPRSQLMTATFNGAPIGTFDLVSDHGSVRLVVPSRLWQIGVNKLDLALPERVEITRVTAR
jgi:hypothetical protein